MRTIEWYDGRIRLIDQRQLPWALAYLEFDDYRAVAQAISDGAIQGSPAIGVAGAYGMALAAQQSPALDMGSVLEFLEVASVILKKALPKFQSLNKAVDRMMALAREDVYSSAKEIRAAMLDEAGKIADEEINLCQRIGKHGVNLIRDGDTILHHGSAGSLFTVDYGTSLGILRATQEQGKKFTVLLTETRPRLQGARLAGWELKQAGINFEIISDAAAGYFMRNGSIKLILLGAERVAANGDTIAPIGTYSLAVLAKENKIPFYVVAPTSAIDLKLTSGEKFRSDERPPEEMRIPYGNALFPDDYPVRNPASDVTPQRYLAGIISESGIALPPFRESLSKIARPTKSLKTQTGTHSIR